VTPAAPLVGRVGTRRAVSLPHSQNRKFPLKTPNLVIFTGLIDMNLWYNECEG